jgi:hypothetical protein
VLLAVVAAAGVAMLDVITNGATASAIVIIAVNTSAAVK